MNKMKRLGNNPRNELSSKDLLGIVLVVAVSMVAVSIIVGIVVYANIADRISQGNLEIKYFGVCQDAGYEFGTKQFENCFDQKMNNK